MKDLNEKLEQLVEKIPEKINKSIKNNESYNVDQKIKIAAKNAIKEINAVLKDTRAFFKGLDKTQDGYKETKEEIEVMNKAISILNRYAK